MRGNTKKGFVFNIGNPKKASTQSVPSAKNLRGQTGKVSAKKLSETAGFGASKKCGSVRGETKH